MSGSWDEGWVLKYLFSYLHPFLCKDPRNGPTLSCVGGQSFTCLIMSSVTPQAQPPTAQIPAFLSVDPRNYTRSPHGLGPMTSYLWVSVHSLPRGEFVRALEQGYSLKWEEEGMLMSTAGKPVVKTFRNQNAAGSSSENCSGKVAKEESPCLSNGEDSRQTLPHTFGITFSLIPTSSRARLQMLYTPDLSPPSTGGGPWIPPELHMTVTVTSLTEPTTWAMGFWAYL